MKFQSIGRKTALKTKASIQRKSRKQLKKEIRHLKLKLKRIQLDKLDDNGQLKKDNINKDKCENADIGGNLTTNKQANEEGDVLMDTAVFSID